MLGIVGVPNGHHRHVREVPAVLATVRRYLLLHTTLRVQGADSTGDCGVRHLLLTRGDSEENLVHNNKRLAVYRGTCDKVYAIAFENWLPHHTVPL